MKLFIVHSGKDKDQAYFIKKIIAKNTGADVLVLENGGPLWKVEAKKLIKQANAALFLIGEHSHESQYIGWELSRCLKNNKQIFCLNLKDLTEMIRQGDEEKVLNIEALDKEQYKIHNVLIEKNQYTKDFQLRFLVKMTRSVKEIINVINKYNNDEYDVFNTAITKSNSEELIEQYKVYLQTSETVVQRRQNVSSFYISVNAAIISISAVISPFINDMKSLSIVIMVISVFGLILDISWIRILESYAVLNSSKLKIIELIEKRLPASLFDKEWEVMSNKLNNKKYVSFTDSEKRIPKIFSAIYIIAFVVFATVLVITLIH